ncbi:MAG: excinuclease ABC subunit UvrB [Parcubacteria group bacterium]|nr:excinuclease ABC subunit UvrB [Parcubacteria group bacterium]
MAVFKLKSEYFPAGDQPQAIAALTDGVKKGLAHQTLLGVTGSGKTFTVANVIAKIGKPTLVIAHNKTLAAQLAQEYRTFFPENAVHYFVSYYDYYQPEAYVPVTDTYIEKEAQINEEIDRLRHAATQSLLTRRDVIIVASVSCIYGLGSPEEYEKEHMKLSVGMPLSRGDFLRDLVAVFYERTSNTDLLPGCFRAVGNAVELMPPHERVLYRFDILEGTLARISKIDAVSRAFLGEVDSFFLFPAKHFVTDKERLKAAIKNIRSELAEQLAHFEKEGKVTEGERLKRRVRHDLALLDEVGYVNGIENYSRHLSGRRAGEPPDTLLSYFPRKYDGSADFLTVIDESHVTVPQIGGMYAGDASRKRTLVEYGFRLPSALDNRPLKFGEFSERVGQILYTSATPADYEREKSAGDKGQIVEQIIRPTGLLDPLLEVRPVTGTKKYGGQIPDFIDEAEKTIKKSDRVLVTTLTKKMAEDLSEFLQERGIKAEYIHSDIKTIERIEILSRFRKGEFDCLVGVNLLREGLDLPEVSLIGILDADKEGFLRSETSLIQIIGRAARNVLGRVILYADNETGSMKRAIGETNRRRAIQLAYNTKNGITPKTIIKKIHDITETFERAHDKAVRELVTLDLAAIGVDKKNIPKLIKEKNRQMNEAVKVLDFESAALLRDEIIALEKRK